jgi:CheY-like chemotaxis protein
MNAKQTKRPSKPKAGSKKQTSSADGDGAAARSKPLVLIVDDVPDNRAIYADFLRFSGYDVVEATDGFEAVEVAKRMLPDVALMDLSLPGMDGWEATRQIKNGKDTKHIKIIAVTGHALEGTAKGAREAGCDAFLSKPCLPETLEEEVKRMLDLSKAPKTKSSTRAKTV